MRWTKLRPNAMLISSVEFYQGFRLVARYNDDHGAGDVLGDIVGIAHAAEDGPARTHAFHQVFGAAHHFCGQTCVVKKREGDIRAFDNTNKGVII